MEDIVVEELVCKFDEKSIISVRKGEWTNPDHITSAHACTCGVKIIIPSYLFPSIFSYTKNLQKYNPNIYIEFAWSYHVVHLSNDCESK